MKVMLAQEGTNRLVGMLEAVFCQDQEMRSSMSIGRMGTQGAWPWLCCQALEAAQMVKLVDLLGEAVGDASRLNHGGDALRNKLWATDCVAALVKVFDDASDDDFYHHMVSQFIVRLGLPLHYAMLGAAVDDWPTASTVRAVWLGNWRSIFRAGREVIGSAPYLSHEEAYWLWCCVRSGGSDARVLPGFFARTNLALIANEKTAAIASLGTLELRLVDLSTAPPALRTGPFVRHPASFSWVLDVQFLSVIEEARIYLHESLKLWPAHLAVEWNISHENKSVCVLGGSSAGAALVIATATILAQYDKSQHAKTAPVVHNLVTNK